MTTQQLYLFGCLYLVILAIVVVLTRATPRRIAGALVGAAVAGVALLGIVAIELGLGDIGWHTFRHSVSSWGKESLKLGQTKELLRHASLATTSELYGDLNLDAKREAQGQLVEHIKASAALANARSQPAGLHRIQ